MIKSKKTISINALSVLVILMCLLLGAIGFTNAWFTDKYENAVNMTVFIGDINLKLYQVETGKDDREIFTNTINENKTTKQYVNIAGEILPGTDVGLNLYIKNEEKTGTSAMYIRYKFNLYAQGVNSDTLIATTLSGYDEPSATEVGVVKHGDYYYLATKNGNTAVSATLDAGKSEIIMQSFVVSVDEFVKFSGSQSLRIELIVEKSAIAYTIA